MKTRKNFRYNFFSNHNIAKKTGFSIVETLIGITMLVLVVGGIIGIIIIVEHFFKNGLALASSQATARILVEEMIRPIRHGKSFTVSSTAHMLTLTQYDGSINVFTFDNGDGDDVTYTDNTIQKDGNIIATNIVKKEDSGSLIDIFHLKSADKLVEINFGVKNEGSSGKYKIIYISTQARLRNDQNLSN